MIVNQLGGSILNILLDKRDFNKEWAYETLKTIIKSNFKVCVIPFAFHESWIKNKDQWKCAYNKIDGEFYKNSIAAFYDYGITDDNICVINYFEDTSLSAKDKVITSDIIFFTGGYPDKIMKRLKEFDLVNTIESHGGIIMGWSAGAMVQCYDYYLSPDEDYPNFTYERGLKCIEDFTVEVHYKNTNSQNKSIEKFIKETGKKVYLTEAGSGIIVDGNKIQLLGKARMY